jgi:hypothetical protein
MRGSDADRLFYSPDLKGNGLLPDFFEVQRLRPPNKTKGYDNFVVNPRSSARWPVICSNSVTDTAGLIRGHLVA